jgi:hypothetical protein
VCVTRLLRFALRFLCFCLESKCWCCCSGGTIRIRAKGCKLQSIERRNIVIKATAADGAAPEPAAEPSAAVEAPASPISELKLQSDILKKLAKKAELKRKRLVRKRHLRKKGRWPPSKMKKNQNV